MTQVAVIIDRAPTAIHRYPTRMDGGKGLFAVGEGVSESKGHGGWMGSRVSGESY